MHEHVWERMGWLVGVMSIRLPLHVDTGDFFFFLDSSYQNNSRVPNFFSPCPVCAPLTVENGCLSVG